MPTLAPVAPAEPAATQGRSATTDSEAVIAEFPEGAFATMLGDINGDGRPEIAVTDRNLHDGPGPRVVSIRAGGSGAVLSSLTGGPGFGYKLEAAGDADADGCPDLLITTGNVQGEASAVVELYSGRTGELIAAVHGEGLGKDLTAVGDVDGDGRADIAATIDRSPEYGVVCLSGRDFSRLWTTTRTARPEQYYPGFSAVAAIGDIDSDGLADLAFAGPSPPEDASGWGRLYLLSAATGAELRSLGDGMGSGESHESVTAIGDLDGDGCPEILARGSDDAGWCAKVVSGRSGDELHSVSEPVANYAWSVAAIGDVDGDSSPDFAVGAPSFDDSQDIGRVFVYSGRSGERLVTIDGPSDGMCMFPPSFGIRLGPAGDFDGDRVDDILIGVDYDFGHGPGGGDRTLVVSGLVARP